MGPLLRGGLWGVFGLRRLVPPLAPFAENPAPYGQVRSLFVRVSRPR